MRHRLSLAALLCCAITAQTPCAHAAWWWPFGSDGIDYSVAIHGLDKKNKEWVESLGIDKKNEVTPPENLTELKQEAVSVAERLRKALDARGYYDAALRHEVVAGSKDKDSKPHIVFHVTPGPRYRVSAIRIDWQDKPLMGIHTEKLRITPGKFVNAASIRKDANDLLAAIGKDSCLLSLSVHPVLELRGATRNAVLRYRIEHGPKANFGPTTIDGTKEVDNIVILRSVRWKRGECFDDTKLESTHSGLMQSQLFASVKIEPDDTVDRFGEVPITITVRERVPRTITAGANYSTDQGVGITAGWEHRNFFGKGEKYNVTTALAQNEQSINNTLRLPAFMRDDQTLVLGFGIKREDQDSYTSLSLNPSATIERKLTNRLTGGIGVAYTLTQTDDELDGKNKYGLLSFPGFLTYDTRDNALDARKGWMGNLSVTPYTETFGDGGQFLKTQATVQSYFSSDSLAMKPTLALRALAGSITGAEGNDVPSDLRFYAGGGGSVRGYDFQALGPRAPGGTSNDSIGGSSVMTATAELRLRFSESFGGVAFLDAGNAYDTTYPDIGGDLYYGAGVGIRYYTAVGPLRVDIGVPLNGKDIDQTGYALYVSVGQAF